MFLADAAPTGAGLAIVGVILLVVFVVFVAIVFFVGRFIWRRVRGGRGEPEQASE